MLTIEGYLEKGRFYPVGNVAEIRGRRRVLVTVLNDNTAQMLDNINAKKESTRSAWLKRLEAAVDIAQDEDLPDFPRDKTMRPPISLMD